MSKFMKLMPKFLKNKKYGTIINDWYVGADYGEKIIIAKDSITDPCDNEIMWVINFMESKGWKNIHNPIADFKDELMFVGENKFWRTIK